MGVSRPPKGILRSAGSARSSELTSHMISPRMSADAEVPGGMPISHGSAMVRSGNTSGQLSSQLGSSQLNRSACLSESCAQKCELLWYYVLDILQDFPICHVLSWFHDACDAPRI